MLRLIPRRRQTPRARITLSMDVSYISMWHYPRVEGINIRRWKNVGEEIKLNCCARELVLITAELIQSDFVALMFLVLSWVFSVCFMWLHLTIFVVNFNTCGWAWRSCCFHQVLPASGRRLQHCGAARKCFYAQQAQSWKIKEKLDLVRSEKIWFRRSKQIVFLKVISIDSRHIRKYFAKVLDQNSKIRACNLET